MFGIDADMRVDDVRPIRRDLRVRDPLERVKIGLGNSALAIRAIAGRQGENRYEGDDEQVYEAVHIEHIVSETRPRVPPCRKLKPEQHPRASSGARSIAERELGPDHPLVGRILDQYAGVLRQMNRKAEAKQSEMRAKAIRAHRASTVDLRELTALHR